MSVIDPYDPQRDIERGDEVIARLPFEGHVVGEVVDLGPRVTIRAGGKMVEVDEAHVWKNGAGAGDSVYSGENYTVRGI